MTREYDTRLGSNIKELHILPYLYILFYGPIVIFDKKQQFPSFRSLNDLIFVVLVCLHYFMKKYRLWVVSKIYHYMNSR